MAKTAEHEQTPQEKLSKDRKAAARRALGRVPDTFQPEAERLWNRMKGKKLKPSTLLAQMKLLGHYARGLWEQGISRYEDATVEAIEAYLGSLDERGTTTAQRVMIMRKLHAFLVGSKRGEYPEVVEWLSPKDYANNEGDGELDPEKLDYYRNHARTALELVYACDNSRDRALVMVLADSGGRRAELSVMQVKDWVPQNEQLAHAKLRGKTGERVVPVSRCVTWMNRWLNDHPDPRPESPLWAAEKSPDSIRGIEPQSIHHVVTEASKKAGHNPVLGPHDLRHGHATECAQLGMNEGVMRARFGWGKGSSMPSKYAHAIAADSEQHALKLAGIDVEETDEGPVLVLTPQTCPSCGLDRQPADARFCYRCGQPLNAEARETLRDIRRMLLEDPAGMESLAQEVAKVLKRGYAINEDKKDVDGVPGLEEL